jgi:hypothetical protein
MPLLRNTGERSSTQNFILWMDGMKANFWCRSLHVECTWSWSSKYKKYLTRITRFDKDQCENKAHMCIISSEGSTYGFGRTNTRTLLNYGGLCFWHKIFQTYNRGSNDSFIKSYLIFQQLNHYGFPKILFTSSGLSNNKIYASQSYEAHYGSQVQRIHKFRG